MSFLFRSKSMQDRVKDIFANSSNPSIIRSASNIVLVALQDVTRFSEGSTSSLSPVDENSPSSSGTHLNMLEELGMQGLADSFQFLPPNRGHTSNLLEWIPALVTLMISWYRHTGFLASFSFSYVLLASLAKSRSTVSLIRIIFNFIVESVSGVLVHNPMKCHMSRHGNNSNPCRSFDNSGHWPVTNKTMSLVGITTSEQPWPY